MIMGISLKSSFTSRGGRDGADVKSDCGAFVGLGRSSDWVNDGLLVNSLGLIDGRCVEGE